MNVFLEKVLAVTIALTLSCGAAAPALAYDRTVSLLSSGQVEQDYPGFIIADGTLFMYTGTDTEVVIPPTVTTITAGVFKDNKKIVSVMISKSVAEIGDNAFSGCTSLQTVSFEDDSVLNKIGENAFKSCAALRNMTLPEGVTTIGTGAFSSEGYFFRSIRLPSTVTTLGANVTDVFPGSDSLSNIEIAEGNGAFYSYSGAVYDASNAIVYCPLGKTGSYEIKNGTTAIRAGAFYKSKLDYVVIPDGVNSIGKEAFYQSKLKTVTIPGSVKTIGESAFFYAASLGTVILEDGVERIEKNAFNCCEKIIDGTVIPASVTYIGDNAFGYRDYAKWLSVAGEEIEMPAKITDDNYASYSIYCVPDSAFETVAKGFQNKITFQPLSNFVVTEGVTLTQETAPLEFDQVLSLTAAIENSEATCKGVSWYSTDSNVASVSYKSGSPLTATVTGLTAGTAQIVAITADGVKAVCEVTVQRGADQSDFIIDGGGYITGYRGGESKLEIPESVGQTPVVGIAASAFEDEADISEAIIPACVKEIGAGAFAGCKYLSVITFEDGLQKLGSEAFSGCQGLQAVALPNSVTDIGGSVFKNCTKLMTANIPTGLTKVPDGMFSGCAQLSLVAIPAGITEIGESTFYNCTSLDEVEFPATLLVINEKAFANCSGMTSLTVPEGVTTIRKFAFYDCTGMETLNLPASLVNIGFTRAEEESGVESEEHARNPVRFLFEQKETTNSCRSMTALNFADDNPLYQSIDGLVYSKDGKTLSFVPRGAVDITVADGTEKIGAYACFICFRLETVKLPSTLKVVGSTAFHYCEAITEMDLPYGLERIEHSAFFGVENWDCDYIPETVTYIGPYAFVECASDDIVIPESITEISEFAFWGYEETLKHISMPDGLKKIGNSAFSWAKNVKNIIIPTGVTSIGSDALACNYSETYITVPQGVLSLGDRAFKVNKAMQGLYIPPTVTEIGNEIVAECAEPFYILSDSYDSKAYEYASENGIGFILLNTESYLPEGTVIVEDLNRIVAEHTETELSVKAEDPGNITAEAAKAVSNPLIIEKFNLTISSAVDGEEAQALDTLGKPATLIVKIPEKYRDTKEKLSLLKIKDGKTTSIPVELEEKYVVAEINETAVYALVSQDTVFDDGGSVSSYRLTFETNGGSSISSISKSSGTTIDLSAYHPTRKGYTFDGWYANAALTTKVDSVKLTKDTTVYAKWTAVDPHAPSTDMPFTDVAAGAYYKDAVKWAVEREITKGTTVTTFSPDMICTRGQAVAFLWRSMVSPAPTGTNGFSDVADGQYYTDAVRWAVEQEVVLGTDTNTFSPDAAVTRSQFLTFLWRVAGSPTAGGASHFEDVTDTGAYYYNAVLWAAAQGITVGTSATTFSPEEICTRAQIVAFLYRYLGQ